MVLKELSSGVVLDAAEEWFLETLTDRGFLSGDEVKTLLRCWLNRSGERTSLTECLVAQKIFLPQAGKALRMMACGYLTADLLPVQVFVPDGLRLLRTRLRLVAQGEDTVCKGPDTIPDCGPEREAPAAPAHEPAPSEPNQRAEESAKDPHLLRTDPVRLSVAAPTSTLSTGGSTIPRPAVGGVVGRCILTEMVGRGATGLVFRALHQSLGIPVAVKVLHRDVLEKDRDGAQQLRTEARLLAQLNHPNIVRVWDFEESDPFPYLILEYVEGWSLAELIQQSGRLRPDRAAAVVIQVAAGLAAAQAIGVVHRDVKPANILLSKEGVAKLADLGLAVVLRKGPAEAGEAAAEGTAGTAAYMSPEQVVGSPLVDHRSDVYSLGATFYHAVTGQIPFQGRSRLEVMLKHTREAPTPPDQIVREIGADLSAVILKMMAKDANDRHATYQELQADLVAGRLRDEPSSPSVDTDTPPRSFWQSVLPGFARKKRPG